MSLAYTTAYVGGPCLEEISELVKEVSQIDLGDHKREVSGQMLAVGAILSKEGGNLYEQYFEELEAAWQDAAGEPAKRAPQVAEGETAQQAVVRERKMRKMMRQLEKLRQPVWTGTHYADPFMGSGNQ